MKNALILILIFAAMFTATSCLKKAEPGPDNKTVTKTTTTDTVKSDTVKITNTPALPSSAIAGDWIIVNDSTTTEFWGLWEGRAPTGKNYIGKPGDHYHFTMDSKAYSKEDINIDTAAYKLLENNHLEFDYSYLDNVYVIPGAIGPRDYVISNLTAHTMTLSGGKFVSPETIYTSIVNLKK